MIGPRAFSHPSTIDAAQTDVADMNITTACELFVSDAATKLVCIQLRSPLASALLESFFDELTQFLQAQQVAELIVLTSSFAHEQHTIEAVQYVHLPSENFRQRYAEALSDSSRWTEWTHRANQLIHGGGFALKLWQHMERQEVPVCILFKYVSEGDNRNDAVQLLDRLDQLLNGRILKADGSGVSVKVPISWQALYGNEPTEQLY